jgi:hypothetical protein
VLPTELLIRRRIASRPGSIAHGGQFRPAEQL